MKKANVIGIVVLCVVLLVACTAPNPPVSSAANMSAFTSSSLPASSSLSNESLSEKNTPKTKAQRAYEEYETRVQFGLDMYRSYFDTHPDNSNTQNVIEEKKSFTFGGKTVTMEKFTVEEGKLLRFSFFYVENFIETYITYYPIDEGLVFCQKLETVLGNQESRPRSRTDIVKLDLRNYFIDYEKRSAYIAIPALEMALSIESTAFPEILEMELLFETGNESIWTMWEELPTVCVPSDTALFPKEAMQKYIVLTEDINIGLVTDMMDTTTLAKRINYVGYPATMTEIRFPNDRRGWYFIESERETRRGEEIVIAIQEELTYTQRLISIYSDWSWSTRTSDDSIEYQLFHLVQEGDVVYILVPECRVAIRSEDFETFSMEDLNRIFEKGVAI